MKQILLFTTILCVSTALIAQSKRADSLRNEINKNNDYTILIKYNNEIFFTYAWTNPDSAIPYVEQNILLAKSNKSDSILAYSLCQYALLFQVKGYLSQALHYSFEALKVAEKTNHFVLIGLVYFTLTEAYLAQEDYIRAFLYATKSKSVLDKHFTFSLTTVKKSDTLDAYINCLSKLAVACEKNNQLDSALKYIQLTEQLYKVQKNGEMNWDHVPFVYGNIYFRKSEYQKAIQYYRQGIELALQGNYNVGFMNNAYGLANAFKKINIPDSAIYYANKVMLVSKNAKYPQVQLEALTLLANVYKSKYKADSSAKYFELALTMKDSLFNREKMVQLQNQTINEQVRQQELQDSEQKRLYQYRIYLLVLGLSVLAIFALLLYRNNQHKQKANIKIEKAYQQLKSTQAQLIQSEKMASLGELTAGIAHEIQNPLNFVNNFSELNQEIIKEIIVDRIKKPEERSEKLLDELIGNINENSEKINHHGKRAESIVKGMLEHSRKSTGVREPTDINKLCEEYTRLAYQGSLAKDKLFHCEYSLNLDPDMHLVNVISQDIGRVILNIVNNAFWACAEREKKEKEERIKEKESANLLFSPLVIVSTRKILSKPTHKIEIKISDNGCGIPDNIKDKIFQPFFTTKPTGQGTGLGLSLPYDIVKTHGGEITMKSNKNEGTEFIIQLPV